MEEWCHKLSASTTALVLTESAAYPIDTTDFFVYHGFTRAGSVATGDFTCCKFNHMLDGRPIPCDKDTIVKVLKNMWRQKVSTMRSERKRFELWHFRCCETHLF